MSAAAILLLAAAAWPAQASAQLDARAREFIERNWKAEIEAPELAGGKGWLNVSGPLTLKDELKGKVVLIDFWTYCCINCMHVLPDLAYLEEKYAKEPFTVVGCHSAKFSNEAEASNVRQAVLRYSIRHPVVVDDQFAIWNEYGVRSWPTLALVGADGRLLAQLSGEGQRDVLDALVSQAIAFYRDKEKEKVKEKDGVAILSSKPLPLRLESTLELARELSFPGKLAVDPEGKRIYISDSDHDRIVVVDLDGRFERAFGSGVRGLKDGAAAEAQFNRPQGLAFAPGALLVADTENHSIRKVDLTSGAGAVTTISGDGKQGHDREGSVEASKASLNSPWDLLVRGNEVLIAMAGAHQIWKLDLDKRTIGPFAGDGTERKADGPLSECAFAQPSGLAEKDGVVYVADSESSSVRALNLGAAGVTTVAGANENPRDLFHFGDEDGAGRGRRFQHLLAVHVHGGVLYAADTYNHKVKTVDPKTGEVKTLAGTGKPGSADGAALAASFQEPGGLAGVGDRLYVADTNNHVVRVIDLKSREVSTLVLAGVPIPMPAASAARAAPADLGPLPDVAGTVKRPEVRTKLAPGKATVRLKLTLPAGVKLAEGAPSQYRVTAQGKVKAEMAGGTIASTETSVAITVEGAGKLEVAAMYYHCKDGASCALRSVRWTVVVEADAKGGAEVVVEDAVGG